MKKIVFIIMIVVSTLGCTYPVLAKSTEEELLQEQQETFGIASFIENTKKYTGSFFEGVDIDGMFQSALKGKIDNGQIYTRILNLLGTEVQNGIKSLVSILIIVLIHSLLKAISDNLENDTIANVIYYVQYIAIVTVIMTNFSDMIQLVKETSSNLVGFMNSLVPILMALMLYTGSITTSSVLEPIILFMIHFVGNLIQTILIPLTLVAATLSIVSKIGDKVQIDKLAKTFHSGIVLVLGIILTIFVGVVSLEGTLSSGVDGITAKTTKAIVSTSIPVVGKILGDVVDSVLGCGIILKNAVGVIGVVIIIGVCILPILKIGILMTCYRLLAGVCEPIADPKIVKLLEQISTIFKVLLAILCSISMMVIIATTLVIKISNSGMMYR